MSKRIPHSMAHALAWILIAWWWMPPALAAPQIALTDEERQWLAEHPMIRMGIDPGYGPYSFVDDSGQPQGVAVDFLRLLEDSLGIRFDIIANRPWKGLMDAIRTKEIDAIATVVHLPERDAFLAFTDPYLQTPLVIMTRTSAPQLNNLQQLEKLRLALVRGYSSSKQVMAQFPDLHPVYVEAPVDGLRAVSLGDADAYVGVLGVNTFVALRNGISGLKINAAFDMETNGQAIAVRKDWAILAPVLDKALKAIPADKQLEILDRWLPVNASDIVRLHTPSLAERLFPWLVPLLLLALACYALVLMWNRQLKTRLDQRLAEMNVQHRKIDRLNGYIKALFDASTDTIFVKDTSGTYQLGNDALAGLLGKPLRQIVGANDFDLFPKELAEQFRADDQRIMASRRTETYEEPVIRPDGTELPFLTTKGPLIINGKLEGIFGIARNISELKRANRAVEQAKAELEERVKRRTAELQRANQELETFTYTVSHDLKAPLRGIMGYSQLLEKGYRDKLEGDGLTLLQHLRESANHMSQLIDDLLAYSRLERTELHQQDVQLPRLIEQILNEFTTELAGIQLELDVEDLSVKSDPFALGLILRNLVDNAIKFSRTRASPRIMIRAYQHHSQVVMEVSDNGIGFDMQYHHKLFEIFQQLHHDETYPGTGIGLAIAAKAAQKLGGTLHATGSLGKGATFHLEFPS